MTARIKKKTGLKTYIYIYNGKWSNIANIRKEIDV